MLYLLTDDLQCVLRAYGISVPLPAVEALGNAGGYSGAEFWRITLPPGDSTRFCLRRWPEAPNLEPRLAWIHGVLHHVAQETGLPLAVPHRTVEGQTWVSHQRRVWELSDWLPGTADYWQAPSPVRLENAMRALALFHCSASRVSCRRGTPGGLQDRVKLGRQALAGQLAALEQAIRGDTWHVASEIGLRLVRQAAQQLPALLPEWTRAASLPQALLPCIRDIWHDHLLFVGDRITGIVDFGAMKEDCVASDLARLLGSLVGNDADLWSHGLAAYGSERPLQPSETAVIAAYHRANVLLSGLNWLHWIYLEGRTFENSTAILRRLARLSELGVANELTNWENRLTTAVGKL